MLDGVGEGAFGFRGRVREREDDGSLVDACHLLEDVGREGTANSGETHENGRLDDVDQFAERFDLPAGVVRASEVNFVLGKFVAAIASDEALYGVDGLRRVWCKFSTQRTGDGLRVVVMMMMMIRTKV